ncbi:MAG: hypothetical protein NTW87_21910 [Planctomycetota bacterium]|nr:hypothetical protein [Planctomycetota bacterium]
MCNRSGIASVRCVLCGLVLALAFSAPAATTQFDCGNPTADEQLVLEYINRARTKPDAEGTRLGIDIHEGLASPSLVQVRPPLAMNKALLSAARGHSQDMYTNNYFDHYSKSGTESPYDRMDAAGYAGGDPEGENIATSSSASAASLEDMLMVDAQTSGRGHRMNLLDVTADTIYREIGIGYHSGSSPNAQGWKDFLTQDFGTSATGPFLVGVVYNDTNGTSFYDIGEGMSGVTIQPSAGSYHGVSSTSGGYAFPVGASGSITVTASGGGLNGTITKTVNLTGVNIKLDFTASEASGGGGGGGGSSAPAITSLSSASGSVGTSFNYTITASGGTPMTFSTSTLPGGLSLSGAVISGTPTTVGTYQVTISATNSAGSGSTTLTITISDSGGGGGVTYVSNTKTDTDGDGFPDEVESYMDSSSTSANSTPFGGSSAGTWQQLILTKMSAKLNFTGRVDGDSISLSGTLPVPANFVVANQQVILDVGGVMRTFTLDLKGRSTPKGVDTFQIRVKSTKGTVLAQTAKFTAKLTKSTFSSKLADEGLVGTADAKGVTRTVPVIIIFNQALYEVDRVQLYYAKANKNGRTR